METLSLYYELKAAGVPMDNHESDLYVLATEESRSILSKHNKRLRPFRSNIDGKTYYDVPFAFEPYWEGKPRV